MAKKNKTEKKKTKKTNYLKEVRKEMKQVTFTKGKEVIKYTCATIIMVIFLILLFLGLSALLSWVKGAL